MAGLDFEVRSTEAQRPLVKALLSLTQRLGAARGCEVRYRWTSSNRYYVTADGLLPSLQALAVAMADSLDPCAIGFRSPLRRSTRVALAQRVVSGYFGAIGGLSDAVGEIAERFRTVPVSYFFEGGRASHLTGRLRAFTRSLLMYDEGRLTADQVAEEAHTVIGLLLKTVCPDEKNRSFAELVHLAHERKYISGTAVLIELKDLRREAKHRGQSVRSERMDQLLPGVVSATHSLLSGVSKTKGKS